MPVGTGNHGWDAVGKRQQVEELIKGIEKK